LIYSPSTGLFIGDTAAVMPSASIAPGIPPEQALDGSLIEAADLKKYVLDIEAFLKNQKGAGAGDVVLKLKTELGFWIWNFKQENFGPAKGAFTSNLFDI
jgi:hypothetical protein